MKTVILRLCRCRSQPDEDQTISKEFTVVAGAAMSRKCSREKRMIENISVGIAIPFLGTSLGAACVYFMKENLSDRVQRFLTGFAAGVMVAASIFSLLIPSLEDAEELGKLSFLPAAVGFWLGILFLLLIDYLTPHLHRYADAPEGPHSHLGNRALMMLAVTIHNIPEGMAVGVVYAGTLNGISGITLSSAAALSLGIAIQNFPEGRSGRTGRCGDNGTAFRNDDSAYAISAEFCRRCNALRGRGGADSGNVTRRAFQYGRSCIRSRLQPHDGSGRGSWLKLRRPGILQAKDRKVHWQI